MSTDPEAEGIVPLRPHSGGPEGAWSEPAPVAQPVVQPVVQPVAQPETGYGAPPQAPMAQPQTALAPPQEAIAQPYAAPPPAAVAPRRRGWIGIVAVAVVGLIVAGTLGYLLNKTTGERDAARSQLSSTQATLTTTQATLATTQGTLTTTQSDLASRVSSAAYASMYVTDSAKVGIDYAKLAACASFSACRTAAQSDLTDMQAFQSDRAAATVPSALSNSDGMLRDAISAAIAADQELISGLDSFSASKVSAGYKKLNSAMLAIAKAEAVLGPELK
jgi:hypothetical protein